MSAFRADSFLFDPFPVLRYIHMTFPCFPRLSSPASRPPAPLFLVPLVVASGASTRPFQETGTPSFSPALLLYDSQSAPFEIEFLSLGSTTSSLAPTWVLRTSPLFPPVNFLHLTIPSPNQKAKFPFPRSPSLSQDPQDI